jgi:4-diphosphocytidyl-2-C-methyl-D-erythritol kinase
VNQWKNQLKNQFEETVFAQYPEIAQLKNMLYQQGAVYASMSGSGSAVFGLFTTRPAGIALTDFPNAFVFTEQL